MLCATVLLPVACVSGPAEAEGQGKTDQDFIVRMPEFPDREFPITDFGAVNDGLTLNTEAINKTIQECSESGGGKVIIPEGVWVTGPLRLMSNVNLFLDEGAVVLFSKNFDDYPFVRTYFEGHVDLRAMPLLFGEGLENIAITGKGIFDGSGDMWRPVKKFKMTDSQWNALVRSGGVLSERGDIWWPDEFAYEASRNPGQFRDRTPDDPELKKYKAFFRPALVQLIECKRILLEGPVFENSPAWCIHPLMCEHLTVNDVTVRNPWYAQNGDGIDVESCKYISITNSSFDVGDDALCLKSGRDEEGRERGMPTQYMVVDNCIVHHGHGGFVVGSEMSGGVRDIWVKNCSFTGTDVGLRFKSNRGRGGVVENIHIENIRMINIAGDAILFNLFYTGMAPMERGEDPMESLIANAPEVSDATPEFRNIFISGISCQGAERAVQVLGLPEMPVNGLSIEKSVFSTDQGINCLFASGLSLTEVTVITADHPTINLINVTGASITGVKGNDDTLLHLDGSETSDILVRAEDIEQARQKTSLGEKTPGSAVSYEVL
jgi:polygalacturonase